MNPDSRFQLAPPSGVRPGSGPPRGRKTVGVLIDHLDHLSGGYEGQLRSGFERACRALDLNLLMISGRALGVNGAKEIPHNAVYELVGPGRVDGIVLVTPGLASFCGIEGISRLCRSYGEVPLCSLGSLVPGIPSIVIDQQPGMEAILDHLIAVHRRRRIAFIGGPAQNPDARLRLDLYREALERHGLTFDPALVQSSYFTIETGAQALSEIAARAGFDAVVAANDAAALGAMDYLKSQGLRVPRDVAVTGFDDVSVARYASPPLSTVRQPLEDSAALAVQLVAAQIAGQAVASLTALPVKAVIRSSCGCEIRSAPRRSPGVEAAPSNAADHVSAHAERLIQLIENRMRFVEDAAPGWPQRLIESLQLELQGKADAFLQALEALIDRGGGENDLYDDLQAVLSLLREELAPAADPALEDLWHAARRLVAAANTRVQTQHRLGVEMAYFHMLRAGEQLSTALDADALKRVLARELPNLHARSAFVSLYADVDRRRLKPLFCMQHGQAYVSSEDEFPASDLFPPDARFEERVTLFVMPLTFETEQLGLAVMEFRGGATVHEMLREQISVALKTAALHAQIVQKTAQHERSVQERLATAERMHSLSVLAGGVAHDLNNALGPLVALPDVIVQTLNRATGSFPDEAELRTDVSTMKLAAQRAVQTIKDLLTLGRQGEVNKEPLDLSAAVVAAVAAERLRSSERRGNVQISLELESEPLAIFGSEPHIVRAIANLLHNAVDAIDSAGSVAVKSRRVRLTEPLNGYETVAPGDYAVVSVTDTGKGIPAQDVARVFEPFFTKKRLSEVYGSGLGLAVVHGVVKDHEGFLDAESRLGSGTTFSLYFRLVALPIRAHVQASRPPGGSATILVIDDDPIQLRTARRVLGVLGYEVRTAQGRADVIEQFARAAATDSRSTPYDLVISDMILNEEYDGLQLFEQIRALCPGQRGILVSGHAPPERERLALSLGLTWLAKPYTADALARAVQAALAFGSLSSRPANDAPSPGRTGS